MNQDLTTAALELARQGYAVFPVYPPKNGKCSCRREDCETPPGKHPIVRHWPDRATNDVDDVEINFDLELLTLKYGLDLPANIGCATGVKSGLFTLDVDPKNGGVESLRKLEERTGKLPEATRDTPSGGWHYDFDWPDFEVRNASGKSAFSKEYPGLDIKGSRGMIILPPSATNKGRYTWRAGYKRGPAPTALLEEIQKYQKPKPEPKPIYSGQSLVTGELRSYVEKAIQEECDWITEADDGFQNSTINDAAFKLGTMIANPAFGLDREEVFARLYDAAITGGHPESRANATITSGLTAGMLEPRSTPPKLDSDSERSESRSDRFPSIDWRTAHKSRRIEPEWLLGKLLARGQQIAFIGPAKKGKSILIQDWCYRMVCGMPFLGDEPREPVDVIYFDRENDQDEVLDRLATFGADFENEALYRLHYKSFPRFSGALDAAKRGSAVDEFEWVLEDFKERFDKYPDVVVFDTVSRFVAGKENDADTWNNFYLNVHVALKSRRIAGVRIDHIGYSNEDRSRGSSGKIGDIDHIWKYETGIVTLTVDGKVNTPVTLTRTESRTGKGPNRFSIIRYARKNGDLWLPNHTRHELADAEIAAEQSKLTDSVTKLKEAGLDFIPTSKEHLREWLKGKDIDIKKDNTTLLEIVKVLKLAGPES